MKKLLSVITLLASIPAILICGMKVLLAAYTVLKCIL